MASYKKKILIVEDDVALRTLLANHFKTEFEILEAGDGSKGVQQILDHKPDLVLLDLLLPNLSGFDLLESVRNNTDPAIASTKVIILSNLATSEDILKAKVLSISDYLVKANTSLDELYKKISDAVNQPASS